MPLAWSSAFYSFARAQVLEGQGLDKWLAPALSRRTKSLSAGARAAVEMGDPQSEMDASRRGGFLRVS